MEQAIASRSCGGCTACCKTHANKHFDKPVGVWCKECKVGVGCGIYGSHPDECRVYKCLWLLEDFPENMRPDRLKVVPELRPEKLYGREVVVATLWEVSQGALQKPLAQGLVEHLKKQMKFVVLLRLLKPSGGYVDELHVPPGVVNAEELKLLVKKLGGMDDED